MKLVKFNCHLYYNQLILIAHNIAILYVHVGMKYTVLYNSNLQIIISFTIETLLLPFLKYCQFQTINEV